MLFEEKTFTIFCENWSKNLRIFVKKSWVREKFWVRFFFLGKSSCFPTEVEPQGFWCSVRLFVRFVKTALYVSEWDFWFNSFFYEFFFSFVTVFRLWAEYSATGAFYLNNNTFRGRFVFWRTYFFLQFFRSLLTNFADFCRKDFRAVWKTAFYTRSEDLLA